MNRITQNKCKFISNMSIFSVYVSVFICESMQMQGKALLIDFHGSFPDNGIVSRKSKHCSFSFLSKADFALMCLNNLDLKTTEGKYRTSFVVTEHMCGFSEAISMVRVDFQDFQIFFRARDNSLKKIARFIQNW